MSKFFMYGTDLHELEQLMMLVPNFMPRRSGVIVVKTVEDKKKPAWCQDCHYPTLDCCTGNTSDINSGDQVSCVFFYRKMVENYFSEGASLRMKCRLEHLVATFAGEIFLNPIHKSRFYTVCRLQDIPIEDRNASYLAILFLLTADNKLWCTAKEHIYLDSFDFKKMHLNGINTDGYAIFQTARTIYTDREYIKQDEIADKTLITEETFKMIINAMLLSKYGVTMFKIKG